MERKNKHLGNISAILCADIHLMENNPVARVDNFVDDTQWVKIKWLKDLQAELKVPVIHSGDLFDYWKPSPELLSKAFEFLPDRFHTVYGNHDLPQHNIELSYKSGIYTLWKGGKILLLKSGHWLDEQEIPLILCNRKILVRHVFTYHKQIPFPGCKDSNAMELLTNTEDSIDLLLTGDNHKPFVVKSENRLLVNPGSFFRITSAQIEHTPRVYLYYAESNSVEPLYVPIKQGVVSREHLEAKSMRENRLSAFIETLNTEYGTEVNFRNNLEQFLKINPIEKNVKQIIYKSIEV